MPGTLTPVLPPSESFRRHAGTDVAQLLRAIGEASASTTPVELFRLCLDAQRLLTQMQAGSASTTSNDEAALVAAYRAMDDDGRYFMRSAAQSLAVEFKRQRARLVLVQSGYDQCGVAV